MKKLLLIAFPAAKIEPLHRRCRWWIGERGFVILGPSVLGFGADVGDSPRFGVDVQMGSFQQMLDLGKPRIHTLAGLPEPVARALWGSDSRSSAAPFHSETALLQRMRSAGLRRLVRCYLLPALRLRDPRSIVVWLRAQFSLGLSIALNQTRNAADSRARACRPGAGVCR